MCARDVLLIREGARVPADGEVLNGGAAVDESPITGESLPVEKSAGSAVFAGSVSRNGTLWLRADRIGEKTPLARIVRRVEEAQEEKAAVERFIDSFARWYMPAAGVLAILIFLFTHRLETCPHVARNRLSGRW